MLKCHFAYIGQKFMFAILSNDCVRRNISLSDLRLIGNVFNTLMSFIQIIVLDKCNP